MKTTVEDERVTGIEEYVTPSAGTGGRTKTVPEDFVVSEVLMDDSKKLFLKKGSGGYPTYVLHKRDSGTLEARDRVQWAAGVPMNVLGLKDKKAVTYQFLSARKKAESPPPIVEEKAFRSTLVAETIRPLKKVDLLGNFFSMRIHSMHGGIEDIERLGSLLDGGGLPNFFGSQRFGRDKPNQLVGEAIVKRKFESAARILLEKELSPEDAIHGLRSVPIALRRLIVQSYQSYLFNLMLSRVLKKNGALPGNPGCTSPREGGPQWCWRATSATRPRPLLIT